MKVFKKQFDTSLAFVDLLNYGVMLTPTIMLGKDGSLTGGCTYSCWDYENSDNAELNDLTATLNSEFLRLGSEYTIHFHANRKETAEYPSAEESHFSSLLTALIDEERRLKFERSGLHFETQLAFTISYTPDTIAKAKLVDLFVSNESSTSKKQSLADKHIATFEATFDELEIQLGSVFTLKRMGLRKEKDDLFNELLEFINLNITGEWRKIRHPDNQFLDGVLATEDFYTEPNLRLGDKYINVLSIDAYPAQSYMGVLQALVNLPCQYHWVNRVCFLDTMDAEKQIEKYRKGWQQKVRGFVDQIMGRHSDNVNYDAVEMKEDAQQAKSENNSGLVRYLYLTSTIVIFDETLESLTYTTKLIRETVRNIVNFNARVETINAVDAYLGSLPSHIIENVRKPIMHSGNMVHIVPCSTLWTGETSAPCPFYPPKSPPLVKVSTTGNSSFNLNLHEEDVGHTFMSGKTGTGKSSKLCLLTAQFDRYPNAQVFIFDKGLSAKVLCKLSGGKHYEILSGNSSICFAPLQNIHEPNEFLWAFNWLQDIVEINNFKMSPEQVKKLNDALKLVAQMDNTEGQYRNIDSLIVKLQDKELKAIFGQYATGGAYKDILNQPIDNIALSQITVFEYGALLDLNAKIKLPVLFYLCHLVECQLDGRPTLVNIDEAWKFLDEKKAGDRLLQWLREWRKSNAAVILSTQNVNAIEQNNPLVFSEISMACSTKLFLANPNATEEQFIGAYKKLGCKDAEIRRVRRLKSKREYFIKKGDFRRTYSLDMNDREIGLSVVGASSKEDLKMIDKLNFEQANEEELLMQWFDYKGLDLDYVQSLIATVKARWPS